MDSYRFCRAKDVSSRSSMESLSQELIIDIFSRLSIQSVDNCKRVCKAWRTLVNEPYFAETHTGKQCVHPSDPQSTSFLLLRTGYCKSRNKLYIEDLIYDDVSKSFDTKQITHIGIPPLFDEYVGSNHIHIGTCKGLVCLTLQNNAYISPTVVYNPVTREYVNLPDDETQTVFQPQTFTQIQQGFGYHPVTKKYKVFRIVHRDGPMVTCSHIRVYTLGGGGKWRIKETQIQYNNPGPSVPFDGCLYWLYYDPEGVHIGYFDLGDEELRMMPAPQGSQAAHLHNSNYCYKLTLLERKLCVIAGMRLHEMNIWVMKKNEENNGYSWSKDFIIPDNSLLCYPNPKLLIRGGEILGLKCNKYGERVIFCFHAKWAKPLRSLGQLFETYERVLCMHWEAVPYMRSIMSLKDLGEQDVKMVVPAAASAAEDMQ